VEDMRKRNQSIRYIHAESPDVKVPAVKGMRYKATVPDTFELAKSRR
jgi:hypothetical protein